MNTKGIKMIMPLEREMKEAAAWAKRKGLDKVNLEAAVRSWGIKMLQDTI